MSRENNTALQPEFSRRQFLPLLLLPPYWMLSGHKQNKLQQAHPIPKHDPVQESVSTTLETLGILALRLGLNAIEAKREVAESGSPELNDSVQEIGYNPTRAFGKMILATVLEELFFRLTGNVASDYITLSDEQKRNPGLFAWIVQQNLTGHKYDNQNISIPGNVIAALLSSEAWALMHKPTNLQNLSYFGWGCYLYWVSGARGFSHALLSHLSTNVALFPVIAYLIRKSGN